MINNIVRVLNEIETKGFLPDGMYWDTEGVHVRLYQEDTVVYISFCATGAKIKIYKGGFIHEQSGENLSDEELLKLFSH